MGETGVPIQSLTSAHLALRLHYSSQPLHYLCRFASHFVTCFIYTEAFCVCSENNIDQRWYNPHLAPGLDVEDEACADWCCLGWLGFRNGVPATLWPKPDVHGLSGR